MNARGIASFVAATCMALIGASFPQTPPLELEIYNSLKLSPSSRNPGGYLLVAKTTINTFSADHLRISKGETPLQSIQRSLPQATEDTIQDYVCKMEEAVSLPEELTFAVPFKFVDFSIINPLIAKDRWVAIHSEYPDAIGLVVFSRVGLNSAKTEALLYFEYTDFSDHSTKYSMILMEHTGKEWKAKGHAYMGYSHNPKNA